MCGRFTITVDKDEMQQVLATRYGIQEKLPLDFKLPRYNVAPGQDVLAVLHDGQKFRAGTLQWGLVPFWAKDEKIGYKMMNAMAETLDEKPSFKSAFKNKRCVLLADGFYEWKKNPDGKSPMRFKMRNDAVFAFAGLWSTYKRPDGSSLYTCTIITTVPNALVSPVHNRMPVILTKEAETTWLDSQITDFEILKPLLSPFNPDLMNAYEVSALVNSSRNDIPECIIPV